MTNLVIDDDLFFTRIISMIPREIYKPIEEDSDDPANTRYYKHRKLPLPPDEKKLLSKEKRLKKYSADEADHNKGKMEEDITNDVHANDSDIVDDGKRSGAVLKSGDAVEVPVIDGDSLETLRKALQLRIQNLKESRTSKKSIPHDIESKSAGHKNVSIAAASTAPPSLSAQSSKSKEHKKEKKAKTSDVANDLLQKSGVNLRLQLAESISMKSNEKKKTSSAGKNDLQAVRDGTKPETETRNKTTTPNKKNLSARDDISKTENNDSSHDKSVVDSSKPMKIDSDLGDIQFSTIHEVNAERSGGDADAGKPGAKMRRLQRMLAEAEIKRKRVESLQASGLEGVVRVKAQQWGDALKAAAGEQPTLDSSKIKKAIKRREKTKAKSAVAWSERLQTAETTKAVGQEKREMNLLKRKHGGEVPAHLLPSSASASEGASGGSTGNGAVSKTPPKRPRLFHVLKEKEKKATSIVVGGKSGGGSSAGGSTGGRGGENGPKGRAGFEGKKQGFLTTKKSQGNNHHG